MKCFPANKLSCEALGPKFSDPVMGCPPTKRIAAFSGEHIVFSWGNLTLPTSVRTASGERFGERNYGSYTYEETIRTFYLFIGQKILKKQTSDKLLSTIDVLPTILDLCGINVNFKLPGKSFADVIKEGIIKNHGTKYAFSETGALHGLYPSPEKPNVFCIKTS